MNKKNRLIILLVAALGVLTIYFWINKKNFTIKKELRDFAVEDTGSIDKIFLADKTGKKILLEKKAPGDWVVNNIAPARNEAVNTLLFTIKSLEVKYPVAKAAYASVLSHMATNAVKTEIYQHGKLVKTYYVGGATQDQLGTFMLIEDSSTPFVIDIPSLNGYLTTRYFTDENQWKSRIVFNQGPSQIRGISLQFPDSANRSFYLTFDGRNGFQVSQTEAGPKQPVRDTLTAMQYLMNFSNLQYEVVVTGITKQKKDSVLTSKPLAILSVLDASNKKHTIKFFFLPLNDHSIVRENAEGPLTKDSDRMYGVLDDGTFALVQHYVFDKVLYSPFTLPASKK